jgi:hypothetical protein
MDLLLDSEESGNGSAISTRVDVYFLPEFYGNTAHAGKSHIGVPRRKAGTLNDTDDLQSAVRKFASEPGAYYAELRAGREVLDSGIFPLKPRAQNIELDSVPTPAPPQDALASVLERLSHRLERLERGNGLTRERAQNAVRVRRRFRDRAPTGDAVVEKPRSLTEQVDEALTVLRKVKAFEAEQSPEHDARRSNPESAENPESALMRFALENPKVRERVAGSLSNMIGEAPQEKHWVVELGEMAFDHADKLPLLGTAVGGLLGSLLGGAQPTPLQPPQPAQAPRPVSSAPPPQQNASTPQQAQENEPPTFENEASTVFNNALQDMDKGASVRHSARDFVSLFREFPEQSKALASQLEFPSELILQLLAAQYPECAPIVTKPGAAAWMGQLQVEIAKRRAPKAKAAAPDASLNGNGSHAESVSA